MAFTIDSLLKRPSVDREDDESSSPSEDGSPPPFPYAAYNHPHWTTNFSHHHHHHSPQSNPIHPHHHHHNALVPTFGMINAAAAAAAAAAAQNGTQTAYPMAPAPGQAPTTSGQHRSSVVMPTLADLQLLFGGGGQKAYGRGNRRAGTERKPRQAYSNKQLETLEDEFQNEKYLTVDKRTELSKSLKLSENQVKTWFQNRRTKWKKQMTASLRHLYRQGVMYPPPYAAMTNAGGPLPPQSQQPHHPHHHRSNQHTITCVLPGYNGGVYQQQDSTPSYSTNSDHSSSVQSVSASDTDDQRSD